MAAAAERIAQGQRRIGVGIVGFWLVLHEYGGNVPPKGDTNFNADMKQFRQGRPTGGGRNR